MKALAGPCIILAGATGDLGRRIAKALRAREANVRAVVRPGTDAGRIRWLRDLGVEVLEVDLNSVSEMTDACSGGSCLVSALAGLRDVMVETQTVLLDAAIRGGIARFIPSDFSADFLRLPVGRNRNFDLRREFHSRLQGAPVAATSIFNGGFADLLTGQAPLILFKLRRVLYWANADQRLDFTTRDNTAEFTAAAALDPSTPRVLRIAGDQISARQLTAVASEVTGEKFRLLRAGDLASLQTLIKITRAVLPRSREVFPVWQGMQYLENMFSGLVQLEPLDNERYPEIRWTRARYVIESR